MERVLKLDPWFDKQPPLSFTEDLKKPLHDVMPKCYGTRKLKDGEISVNGLYIANEFPDDPDRLLETIYDDFNKFLKVYKIGGNKFPVYLKKEATECFEAHIIDIKSDSITIIANDTEGIRRGIIYLEDELRRREGAYLEVGEIKRTPKMRSRITRCFFSPINRPPKFGDELSDDIDYYPEEYLNRLMHDGSNGVWIYTRFSDLVPSSIIEENGKGYEARIEKLNRVIKKCARYGIGVYLFLIEPAALTAEQAEKYPDLVGIKTSEGYTFCTSTELGKKYCYEMGSKLVEFCPKLRGILSVTCGERNTTCASTEKANSCPRCSKVGLGKALAEAVKVISRGFLDKNPDFEYISWTYGHRGWDSMDDILEYVDNHPDDAIIQDDHLDKGYPEQLGKTRQCIDYWNSYTGPSDFFKTIAKRAQEKKKHMFAKMQICTSHELASVPYIPTPGFVYEHFKSLISYGIEGVTECWYFGNYPSIMSKAAGEMAFSDNKESKDEFLKRLAGIYWGESKAEAVMNMWNEFEKGYSMYPKNIVFSYYGPMHDSVVWKLALLPKNFSLPRSWQSLDPIDGDRIGDALHDGHTLDEALTLLNMMSEHWQKGMGMLSEIDIEHPDETEQANIAEALAILIASARNILEFYKLRDDMGLKIGDAGKLLARMHALVLDEIENSKKMIPLCKKDNRLGYHSEAEGFKFFPEKIEERIEQLKELLATEFVEVEERIKKGLTPLKYYDGVEDNDKIKSYKLTKNTIENAEWEVVDKDTDSKFRMSYDDEYLYMELKSKECKALSITPEFKLLWGNATIEIFGKNPPALNPFEGWQYFSLFGERGPNYLKMFNLEVDYDDGIHITSKIKRTDIGHEELIRPFKMRFDFNGKLWCVEEKRIGHLGKYFLSPGEFGWVLP